ncbi:MAG: hypothetical protein KDA42_19805, partial [Planctomycetales bacterium]|nr:hypothetical protein [Planctomycetales bacterium]
MFATRCRRSPAMLVASVLLASSLARGAEPERFLLQAQPEVGQATHVVASLEVGGDLKLQGENKVDTLPMSVGAELEYDEQLLAVPAKEHYQ